MESLNCLVSNDVSGFYEHLLDNTPVLIKCDIHNWKLNELFYNGDQNFNTHMFCKEFGDKVISVHVNDGAQEEITINEFITRVDAGEGLYAKDWHFFQFANTEDMYKVPHVFMDDWLNVYWKRIKNNADDYRFLYIGGKDTVTGVHHDVLYSYSWSINLHGRKKWTLWRPEDTKCLRAANKEYEEYVKDARHGHYDAKVFPCVSESEPLTVVQDVGDAIFVPSGWYHMVQNLSTVDNYNNDSSYVTLSVNHNWINGFNVHDAWMFMLNEMNNIRREMWEFLDHSDDTCCSDDRGNSLWASRRGAGMDKKEWLNHCELSLKINSGLGFKDFLEMIFSRSYSLGKIHLSNLGKGTEFAPILQWDRYSPLISQDVEVEPSDVTIYNQLQVNILHSLPVRQEAKDKGKEYENQWCIVSHDTSLESLMSVLGLGFPISTFQYSMLQVLRILMNVKNCDKLKEYSNAIFDLTNVGGDPIDISLSNLKGLLMAGIGNCA